MYQVKVHRGCTLAQLAIRNGLSGGYCHQALWKPYPAAEQMIADAIGLPPQAIWPERYGRDGRPNRGRRPRKVKDSASVQEMQTGS
jgi:Ner family transcriptional regulator